MKSWIIDRFIEKINVWKNRRGQILARCSQTSDIKYALISLLIFTSLYTSLIIHSVSDTISKHRYERFVSPLDKVNYELTWYENWHSRPPSQKDLNH